MYNEFLRRILMFGKKLLLGTLEGSQQDLEQLDRDFSTYAEIGSYGEFRFLEVLYFMHKGQYYLICGEPSKSEYNLKKSSENLNSLKDQPTYTKMEILSLYIQCSLAASKYPQALQSLKQQEIISSRNILDMSFMQIKHVICKIKIYLQLNILYLCPFNIWLVTRYLDQVKQQKQEFSTLHQIEINELCGLYLVKIGSFRAAKI